MSEVSVDGRDEPLLAEVGLAHTRDLAGEPPPQRVRAVAVDQRARIDRVAERLADLATACGQVVVHEDLVRPRHARRQEDGGPDHCMEAQDALADDVPSFTRPAPA